MPDPAQRARAIVRTAEYRARASTPRKFQTWIVAGLSAALLGALVLFGLYINQAQRTATLTSQLDSTNTTLGQVQSSLGQVRTAQNEAASSAQALADQVKSLGHTPVVTPPQPITGPAGATGPAGSPGRNGASPTCLSTPTQCVGATGATGTAGQPGRDGAVGATGPAGPAGPPGVTGPAGPQGQQGTQGAQGPPGTAGTNGAPPAGWTYTDTLGTQHTCTRNASSPDSAPTYACT